jgi:histone deacetylase complex regulatory component SIN3
MSDYQSQTNNDAVTSDERIAAVYVRVGDLMKDDADLLEGFKEFLPS